MAKNKPGQAVQEDRDYPLQPVPQKARVGIISISAVLLGFTFFTPTMLGGAQIGVAFKFWPDFFLVLATGSIILGFYVALLSVVGSETGLTTVLLSRYTLGSGGAKWADLLLGGTQIGWYGVAAASMAQLFAQALGWQEYLIPLMIFWSLLMGLTAYVGYKGMEILSYISVPLILVLGVWVTFRSVGEVGGWAGLAALEPIEHMSFATALTIIVGTFASGGTQAPNWTRFSKSAKVAFWSALIAFLVGNGLMLFFGAIGAITYQEADFVLVLYKMGLIFWGIIFLTLNLWTTNDNAAYAFGVAGAEFFGVNSKKPFVVGGVIIATILAVTGIYNFLVDYLVMLGIFIPPLGGVILGDYFFVWKKDLPELDKTRFPAFRWSSIVSYLLGTLAAYLGERYGIGIAPLNGILIAGLSLPLVEKAFASFGASDVARMKADR
ncbi:MAG: cytosine permease [Halanaerobium sp.]|nr:cytosine permease [Halanaerobium sp.]